MGEWVSESGRILIFWFVLWLDPFSDATGGLSDLGTTDLNLGTGLIHIRIQQRNGRKTLTTVQGISEEFDKKKLVRAFKKDFACNGTVVEHPEYGEIIQLQGDQRSNVCTFLKRIGIAKDDQLKVFSHQQSLCNLNLTFNFILFYSRFTVSNQPSHKNLNKINSICHHDFYLGIFFLLIEYNSLLFQ